MTITEGTAVVQTLAATKTSPPGWRSARLGDVIREAQGGFASGERDPQGIIQLRMNNVTNRGTFDWSSYLRVPAEASTIETYRLQPGDVLFNNTNSTELVGKSVLFEGHEEAIVYSNHFTRLRTMTDKLLPAFLALWLQEQWQQRVFENICNRWIGQSAVQRDKLLALEIPLAPLAEQQRIAALLTEQLVAVERARRAAEAQVRATRGLQTAFLNSVFNSATAREWPVKRIGDVARLQQGYAFKSDWFTSDGLRLLRNANVHQGFVDWSDSVYLPDWRRPEFTAFELSANDIVLSLDRPVVSNGLKVTRLSPSDIPSLLLQRVGRFRVGADLDSDYLFAFLNSSAFIAGITGHDYSLGVPHVSPSQVEAIEIPVPAITQQRSITTRLNGQLTLAKQTYRTLQTQLDAIDSLPAALLRQAFSGEM